MSLAPDPVELDLSASGVAIVTLSRPAKKNAMDELMIAQLGEAFATLATQDRLRVVFLRGAGDAFCAGADVEWMRRQGTHSQLENEADALALARMLKALHGLPQLTVALVQGAAFGGGAGLVAACDYAIATSDARFRFSEVRLGLTPATISPYVVEAIGARNARALFASALPFDAQAAQRYGLVHEIVADTDGLVANLERLSNLALENAPGAVAQAKALVQFLQDDAVRTRLGIAGHLVDDHVLHETARQIAARRASQEGQEGLAAFLERRDPDWRA
jgi:methylglutaconyl-CoA hydratase